MNAMHYLVIIWSAIFGVLIPFVEIKYFGFLPSDPLVFAGNAFLSVLLAYLIAKVTLSLRDQGRYQP
jgi:hypothetical protein